MLCYTQIDMQAEADLKMGMYEAKEMRTNVPRMLKGAFATCSWMPTFVVNSAAKQVTTPSMASRPLMVSGAGPSKACASAQHNKHLIIAEFARYVRRKTRGDRTCWCGLAGLSDVSTLLCVFVADVSSLDVLWLAAVDLWGLCLD